MTNEEIIWAEKSPEEIQVMIDECSRLENEEYQKAHMKHEHDILTQIR